MKAVDVMTRDVVSIDADRPVRDVAQLLLDRHISAVPVVDPVGRLLGLVSEGDLLRRVEAGTERRRAGWRSLIATGPHLAAEYTKAHGRRASDIMTREVVTATEDASLRDVADLLEQHRIKRVPVVRDHVVVGIVSRADILRALLAAKPEDVRYAPAVDDDVILLRLQAELRNQKWARSRGMQVAVRDGVVELSGSILSEAERTALRVAAERIPGVRKVEDKMTPVEAAPGM